MLSDIAHKAPAAGKRDLRPDGPGGLAHGLDRVGTRRAELLAIHGVQTRPPNVFELLRAFVDTRA